MENVYGMNIIQKATTGSYCEKCDVIFKSKKSFKRHLEKSHETNTCGRCDDILHTWTQSRVHVHKHHEDIHYQYDPNLKTDENNI